jgi:hypothetical protein
MEGRFFMKTVSVQYFKDSRGEWHQPGNIVEVEEEESRALVQKGFVKIIRTAMVKEPENRVVSLKRRVRR